MRFIESAKRMGGRLVASATVPIVAEGSGMSNVLRVGLHA
jgi:hypothetical protein